ncbi:MAG: PorV/PorQ family protein [Flavobacteriales bacterium]|nr:PorV/PorQ family protein [Flavobacteriales bacterium]
MNLKKRIFLFVVFIFTSVIFAQTKYSNEFLSIGVDARAFAMGNSVVAHQKDVNAGYWNPAGLTRVESGTQGALMHAEYFQSIAKYDYAAVAFPFKDKGTLAVSLIRFGVDDILNTTELIDSNGEINYDRISKFSTSDYALTASYAGNFFNNKDISVGVNTKLIYRNVGKFANSFGFGIDAGIQYQTQDDFHFGLMARDITTTFNVWSVNEQELNKLELDGQVLNSAPKENIELTLPKLQLGVAKHFDLNDKFQVISEVDLNLKFYETNDYISGNSLSIDPSIGFEVGYDNIVYLRGGVNNFQNIENFEGKEKLSIQPNLGIGFKYRGIYLDYAITNLSKENAGLYSNIFSLKLDFSEF